MKHTYFSKKCSKVLSGLMALTLTFSMAPLDVASAAETSTNTEEAFDIGMVNFDAVMSGEHQEASNYKKMKSYIQEAYKEGDEILVFPEYALTSEKTDAIDIDTNKSVQKISALADTYDMYILFGSVTTDADKYFSSLIICDPEGEIDVYNKTHLTDEEYEAGFSVGDDPYVLSTPYGNFGLALGQEFAQIAELGKYYYGAACRQILVAQSYGYTTGNNTALSQAEYDMYTATYAYVRMYSRYVAVANLYTTDADTNTTYFGESHACTNYSNGWIAGCGEGTKPVTTTKAGIVSGSISAASKSTTNGMSSRRLNQLADWYGNLCDYQLPAYGSGSKYKDNVKVASVNYHPVWGDLDTNVASIKSIMASAHKDGVELLVFPEMALTGYDVVTPDCYDEELKKRFGNDYMQHVLAQTVRGNQPSSCIKEIQELAESYGMYVLIGLPEQDEVDPDLYWNSVAILGPDLIQSYRKVNLANPEPNWAAYSTENDGYFETPFGYVGVAICADIYNYQELQRTYAEMGCRIVINCTAGAASNNCSDGSWQLTYQNRLESFMLRDHNFMITSNLVGYEGPVTTAVTQTLEKYGYTIDDLDTTWFADDTKKAIFKEVTDLYGITNVSTGAISARTYIFPGASVCIGLDDRTETGTYVFGNYTSSGVTSDGTKNPYMNITPDTFNQYYSGDFDLSKATLETFYNTNPYDYRPDTYYKWYSHLFYNTYGYKVGSRTITDADTGITISGDSIMEESKFDVTTEATPASYTATTAYDVLSTTSYQIAASAKLTTEYTKRNLADTSGTTIEKQAATYTGSYVPFFGDLLVTIPVSADFAEVYDSATKKSNILKVTDHTVTVKTSEAGTLTVSALKEHVTTTPEGTTGPSISATPAAKAPTTAKITSAKSPKKDTVKLTFKKASGVKGFKVIYSTKKNFSNNYTTVLTTKKTLTLTGLKSKKYYVKAKAYKIVNGKKIYSSKWSAVKTVSVK